MNFHTSWFHDFSSQRQAVPSRGYEVKGGGHTVVYEHSADFHQKTRSVYKGDCYTGDLYFYWTFPTVEPCFSVSSRASLRSTKRAIDFLVPRTLQLAKRAFAVSGASST